MRNSRPGYNAVCFDGPHNWRYNKGTLYTVIGGSTGNSGFFSEKSELFLVRLCSFGIACLSETKQTKKQQMKITQTFKIRK